MRRNARRESFSFHSGPLQALYETTDPLKGAFSIPLTQCVDALGFRFSPTETVDSDDLHPYTRVLLEYAHDETAYTSSVLKSYYEMFRPERMVELFPETSGSVIADHTPNTHFTPWFLGNVDERIERTRKALQREFRHIAIPGNPLYGPVTDEQGEIEYARIVSVYRSVQNNGYVTPTTRRAHIQGFVLRRGDDIRFVVTAGKHRVAALAALRADKAVVVFRRPIIIEERDVDRWPYVEPEGWSRRAALEFFDRLFRGVSCIRVISGSSQG